MIPGLRIEGQHEEVNEFSVRKGGKWHPFGGLMHVAENSATIEGARKPAQVDHVFHVEQMSHHGIFFDPEGNFLFTGAKFSWYRP